METDAYATRIQRLPSARWQVSEDLFERGLCLPSGTQMTEEDLEQVITVIKSCCKAG